MKIFGSILAASLLFSLPAQADPSFHFDDLRAFNAALAAVDAGESPHLAFETYVENASPAFSAYAERYDATAQSIADAYVQRPGYYRGLPALEAYIATREAEITAALNRLQEMAPVGEVVPSYFMVANQTAGGTPVLVRSAAGPQIYVAIAVDMMAISEATDMGEFPNGTGGRANVSDLPQVVIHENAHVLQLASQGGLENYLSIYASDSGSMLAIAVREGCAEYLTYLASGWRLGDRHIYAENNERELWAAFQPIMNDPPFSVPGWFGGTHTDHADWPSQIGYSVGFQICEHHYQSALNPDAALRDLFSLYAPDDVQSLADAYGASLTAP